MQACRNNAGVIANGIRILLTPIVGKFDSYMYTSSASIRQSLLPLFSQEYDWRNTYLDEALKRRGVADIPNFLYKEDAGAIYKAMSNYAEAYITPYYKEFKVADDQELTAFVTALSTGEPGQSGFLKGFPGPAGVKTAADVSKIVSQVMWLTGASHHALNTLMEW